MFTRLERLLRRFWFVPLLLTFAEDGGGDGGGAGAEGAAAESSGPLDREARIESALEIFEGKEDAGGEGDQGADGEGKEGAAAEGADGEAAQREAADKAKIEGEQLSDEQLQKDPRFQSLDQFQKEHKPIFDKYGVPNAKELDLQLADSAVLYGIMEGKGTPSQLLDTMAATANWSKEQQQAVANDLIGWLTKAGYLKDGQGKEGQARAADGKFKDPLEERLDRIEKERKDAAQAETDRKTAAHKEQVFSKYKGEIERLAKEKGLDPADFDFIGREVRALVKPEEVAAFTEAIDKGNFVKVRELFAQIHNREVARLKRWNGSLTKTHERQQRSAPRVPAGGAPPAPAGQQKRNLSNRDERLAAAAAEFDK